jgi:NAD(P)-dependent dehydrogenase (short-subunit alcohol dehydrogenase family)
MSAGTAQQSRVAVVTGGGRGFGREIARRLAGRGYAVLVTDLDAASAEETAREIGSGAWSRALDVRDPEAHRAAAAEATDRGRLAVWVNNAGVLRTEKAWEHSDADVRLIVETNVLGVMWGSRAAIEAMRTLPSENQHVLNVSSMSAFGPVPGLAVYASSKHAVLGFTTSLQGDLLSAGLPIRVHALCPDGADTAMVRERAGEREAAIIWSGSRLLTPQEVADGAMALLDSRRIVMALPGHRAVLVRALGFAPGLGVRLGEPLRRLGERRRSASARDRAG